MYAPGAQPRTIRVAAGQIENVVGDLDGNAGRILAAMRWAEEQEADVVVFPELALTGYPLADLALRNEFVAAARVRLHALAAASGRTAAVVGTIDRVSPRRAWDTRDRDVSIAAAVLCDGEIRGIYHKLLLPAYEGFDEARTFAPGTDAAMLWRIGEAVAGVCICEDMWSGDGPPEEQAAAGAQILLVPNASSFHREKPAGRLALATQVARRNGMPVVYVNCVGGQDELVFDGGSLVVDANGDLLARARQFEAHNLVVDVPLGPPRTVSVRARTVHVRPTRPQRPLPRAELPPEQTPEEQVWQALVLGTRDFARKNGTGTAVLGLSGGIDAAITAAVASEALGPECVLGLAMPAPDDDPDELEDAEQLARALGIDFRVIPIDRQASALGDALGDLLRPGPGTTESLVARARADIVLSVADELGHLALATGNKSELSIGVAALHGDLAGSFAPLKDCPKTLLYRLATWRNGHTPCIPRRILSRPPSVHTAADDPLPPYAILDPIVERYIEQGESPDELIAAGFDATAVRGVLQLVDDSEFKRRMTPPGVKITARAFGSDLRMPITNAWRPFRDDEPRVRPEDR